MEHWIPDQAFEAMPQIMLILIAAAAISYLMKGADWLVDSAAGLASLLGIPKVIVGATIISLGTTSPEAAVSVMAAWGGDAGLALGNAVGSIIADTGLIFGLGCILVVLPADPFVLKRQGCIDIISVFLLAALCYTMFAMYGQDAALGRGVGYLLVILLVLYMVISVRWSKQHPGDKTSGEDEDTVNFSPWKLIGMGFLGLALVILSSRFVIGSVKELATTWDVPQVVIAATLVAFGTSLPELVVGMTAIYRGHGELLVGNIIGADILNVLFVVGAAAVARPLFIISENANVPEILLYLHLPTMLIMITLFMVYISAAVRRGSFRKWYGYPLLGLYVTYVFAQWILEAGG